MNPPYACLLVCESRESEGAGKALLFVEADLHQLLPTGGFAEVILVSVHTMVMRRCFWSDMKKQGQLPSVRCHRSQVETNLSKTAQHLLFLDCDQEIIV